MKKDSKIIREIEVREEEEEEEEEEKEEERRRVTGRDEGVNS